MQKHKSKQMKHYYWEIQIVDTFSVNKPSSKNITLGSINEDLEDIKQEMRLEKDRPHLRPDFDATALAEMLGVSMTRLVQLFRHQTIHRTPDAYIDNLRVLAALRLLREQPNYTIAVVAEEAGFSNVRTLQRRIQEAIGMSPVDYRLMLTRDL